MSDEAFEPRIIGFLCHWCSYAGADTAGVNRITYPPNMIPIRVRCSGRIDPAFVLKAFREGADGVLISGCHMNDCHYEDGNVKALRRYPLLMSMLEQFGIERERVRLEWISAWEGEKLAQVASDMTETLKALGPLDWPRRLAAASEESV